MPRQRFSATTTDGTCTQVAGVGGAGTGGELGTGDDEVRGLPRPPTSTQPMGGVVRGVGVGKRLRRS